MIRCDKNTIYSRTTSFMDTIIVFYTAADDRVLFVGASK